MQVGILTVQGIIVSVLALLSVVVPDVQTAFVTLADMAAALYLVMYVLMFAAAIRLRRTQPDVLRTYRTPAMRPVAGIGLVACVAAFVMAFIRPEGFTAREPRPSGAGRGRRHSCRERARRGEHAELESTDDRSRPAPRQP